MNLQICTKVQKISILRLMKKVDDVHEPSVDKQRVRTTEEIYCINVVGSGEYGEVREPRRGEGR